MEAVTIHSDDHDNKAQVIHTYAPSGLVSSLILAQVSRNDATITYVDITGHANRSINLPEEAMDALMTLWGVPPQRSETGSLEVLRDAYGDKCEAYEAESHARMAAVNDLGSALAKIERLQAVADERRTTIVSLQNTIKGMQSQESPGYTTHEWQVLHDTESAEIERLRGVVRAQREQIDHLLREADLSKFTLQTQGKSLEREHEANEALRNEIARMLSQESFRMALLESVVSAARDVMDKHYTGFAPTIGAISDLARSLDHLDEWSMTPSTDVSVPVAPPNMPSLAYVHTKTVIYNQKLRAVAEAAREWRDNLEQGYPISESLSPLATALALLDTWEADATAAMLSDDAEDMSAVPAKE